MNEKGFTLIEVMVVVAIIGILAAIALPRLTSMRENAYNAAAISDLEKGVVNLEAFYNEYHHYPNSQNIVQGPTNIVLTDGVNQTKWAVSDGVNLLYTKGASSGFCLAAKHTSGNRIYMLSNASMNATELKAPAKSSTALQSPGATITTVDCSNMVGADIANISVN